MMLDRECIMIVINLEQPRGLMVGMKRMGELISLLSFNCCEMNINLSVNRRGVMDT